MTVLLKLLFLRCCEEKTRKIRTQLYSNLIMGVKEALGSVSINAKSILSVTHTFTVPDGYQKIPIMAYAANTGWTGVICQGISVNISTGAITFTFFNSLDNAVTASPQSVAMFLKN